MDEQAAQVQRSWCYAAFIDELKPLIEQVKHFGPQDKYADSVVFKTWLHKVTSLCTRINRTHVDSTCRADQRYFQAVWSTTSRSAQREAFDRDLRDTITELEHIVDQYVKFGEPALRNTPAAKALKADQPSIEVVVTTTAATAVPAKAEVEREWPKGEKASWKWIRENIPFPVLYSLLAFIVAVAGASFGLGMWVDSLKTQSTTVPVRATKP